MGISSVFSQDQPIRRGEEESCLVNEVANVMAGHFLLLGAGGNAEMLRFDAPGPRPPTP